MFVKQLIAVGCLLFAVEFLEAKNINRYKKTSVLATRQTECEFYERKCPTSDRCIRASYFCDGDNDCGDDSDEQNCGPLVCTDSEKEPCPSVRRCINRRYFCDTDNDCRDNSDEDESFCRSRTCQANEVRCNNGQCLDKEVFCRGDYTCRDGSVNANGEVCADIPFSCSEGYAQCPNSRRCINKRWFCDGDNDCGDNSDEEASFCRTRTCQPNEVRCNNGQCLDKNGFCGSQYSCRDDSLSINGVCGFAQPPSGPSGPPFPSGGPSPAEMQCYMAMTQFQATCLNNPFIHEFQSLAPDALFEKLTEIDMRELCGYVQQPLQCFKNAFSQCSGIDNPMIQAVNQQISLAEQLFNSVCVQEVDILNRHKACLLRKADGPPVPMLAMSLQASCSHTLPPQLAATPCLPANLIACGKNVVAQQCGDEIAGALDRIGSHFTCPSYHKRSKYEPLKKRTPAFPFQRDFLKKYFF